MAGDTDLRMINLNMITRTLGMTKIIKGERERQKESEVVQGCLIVCDSMDCIARQAPLSMEFFRQGY